MPTVFVQYIYFSFICITNNYKYPNKIQKDCKQFCSLRRTATFEHFGELDFQHYDAAMEAVNITNNGKTIQVTMRYFHYLRLCKSLRGPIFQEAGSARFRLLCVVSDSVKCTVKYFNLRMSWDSNLNEEKINIKLQIIKKPDLKDSSVSCFFGLNSHFLFG
jgi:hypothetical protein